VHSELIHSRFAMAGVAGILIPDILTHVGLLNVPVWYNQGLIAQQGSFAPFSAPRRPWPARSPCVAWWRGSACGASERALASRVPVRRALEDGCQDPELAGDRLAARSGTASPQARARCCFTDLKCLRWPVI